MCCLCVLLPVMCVFVCAEPAVSCWSCVVMLEVFWPSEETTPASYLRSTNTPGRHSSVRCSIKWFKSWSSVPSALSVTDDSNRFGILFNPNCPRSVSSVRTAAGQSSPRTLFFLSQAFGMCQNVVLHGLLELLKGFSVCSQSAVEEEGGVCSSEDRAAVCGAGCLEGLHASQQHVGSTKKCCCNVIWWLWRSASWKHRHYKPTSGPPWMRV